jgi:hypothetical protein
MSDKVVIRQVGADLYDQVADNSGFMQYRKMF